MTPSRISELRKRLEEAELHSDGCDCQIDPCCSRYQGLLDIELDLSEALDSIEESNKALKLALVELKNIGGWSGSYGNWPLHDAISAVKKALEEE